jgi:hypothetical protein
MGIHRKNSRCGLLQVALLSAALGCAPRPKPMPDEPPNEKPSAVAEPPQSEPIVSLHFSGPAGPRGSVAMEVKRDGESSLIESYAQGAQPELGSWRASLPPERFERLLSSMRAAKYDGLRDGPAYLRPGQRVIGIGERRARAELPTTTVFPLPPPEELAEPLRLFEAVRMELHRQPERVLRAEVTWKLPERQLKRGDAARLELHFRNIGNTAFETGNPARDTGKDWNGLRLVLAREDKDDLSIDLTPVNVHVDAAADRGAALTLEPGASKTTALHVRVDVPSGSYDAQLEFHSLLSDAGRKDRVVGSFAVSLGKLVVRRDGIWKVWR